MSSKYVLLNPKNLWNYEIQRKRSGSGLIWKGIGARRVNRWVYFKNDVFLINTYNNTNTNIKTMVIEEYRVQYVVALKKDGDCWRGWKANADTAINSSGRELRERKKRRKKKKNDILSKGVRCVSTNFQILVNEANR